MPKKNEKRQIKTHTGYNDMTALDKWQLTTSIFKVSAQSLYVCM